MARDPVATRAKILTAAVAEFSAHGLAGARVDRLADIAGVNKRSIYVYFGNKEGLYEAALASAVGELAAAVPVTPHDLPGYAGRLHAYLVQHPEVWRMSTWQLLERPPAVDDDPGGIYADKVRAMTPAAEDPDATQADAFAQTDLVALINGIATGWLSTPLPMLAVDGRDPLTPDRRAAHREAVEEAVRRLIDGPRPPAG